MLKPLTPGQAALLTGPRLTHLADYTPTALLFAEMQGWDPEALPEGSGATYMAWLQDTERAKRARKDIPEAFAGPTDEPRIRDAMAWHAWLCDELAHTLTRAQHLNACATCEDLAHTCPYHKAFLAGKAEAMSGLAGLLEALAEARDLCTWVAQQGDAWVCVAPGHLVLYPNARWGPPGLTEPATFPNQDAAEAFLALASPWWTTPGWRERAGLKAR